MPPQSPATTIKTKSEAMPREHLRDSLFRPEGYPNWAVGVDVSTHSSRSCAKPEIRGRRSPRNERADASKAYCRSRGNKGELMWGYEPVTAQTTVQSGF